MIASVNRVILLGTLSRYGVELRYAPSGTPCASFTLVLTELGTDGQPHQTWVACEVWSKRVEAASELEPGQLVLFEGKLTKRKKGEQWETLVSGFELMPVQLPLPTLMGNPN
jgi:single-stranded DNA-binding protein